MRLNEIVKGSGTYVAAIPTPGTLALLEEWSREHGIPLDPDLHVTLLYTRRIVNVVPSTSEFVATGIGFDLFGDALVLKLESQQLSARHDQFMAMGGTHDYERYNPHLTLQAKTKMRVTDVPPINFGLIFHQEYSEPLDP